MIKVLDIENIKIPSVNNKYYKNFSLRSEYRNFKKLIHDNLINGSIEPPYSITILFKGYIDIDNPVKPILDALEDKGLIDDDKNVRELHVVKVPGKRGHAGALTIFIDRATVAEKA